jgi:hypothetical protein
MRIKKFKLTPKIKHRLDKLFTAFIHKRDKDVCQLCGSKENSQCAHIMPREYIGLRYSPDNAILLCPRCHRLGRTSFHQNPLFFYRWFSNTYGEEMIDKLLEASHINVQFTEQDVKDIEEMLKKT